MASPVLDPHTAIAIRAAFHEGTSDWQSERITAWVTATIAQAPSDAFQWLLDDLEAGAKPLSPRENEVMELASQGLTPTQSARRLRIAVATVATHRQRAKAKLGVCSFADAVALWRTHGLSRNLPGQDAAVPPLALAEEG